MKKCGEWFRQHLGLRLGPASGPEIAAFYESLTLEHFGRRSGPMFEMAHFRESLLFKACLARKLFLFLVASLEMSLRAKLAVLHDFLDVNVIRSVRCLHLKLASFLKLFTACQDCEL